MLTKADFQRAITDSIARYPAIAPLHRAGDPRIAQHLDAMAAMLALFSAQLETSLSEPFEKARDSTVLADAAMRGIVRKASPVRARIRVVNGGTEPYRIDSGRTLIDVAGLPYRIETSATVPAGGEATFEAVQLRTATIRHGVHRSEPFYAIEIPLADDGAFLCGIAVTDAEGEFAYRERYVNTAPGERIYHVEADDRQRVFVRFGYSQVVGVQPADGAEILLSVSYTAGAVQPAFGSPFSFEYLGAPQEAALMLTLDALLVPGQNPPPMSVLRDLARYPSVYDHNAVFLGEFDFLVRRNFSSLRFLSVWNESAEERARGASLDNINTLFIACLSETGNERVLQESDPEAARPALIGENDLTDTQRAIRRAILEADDSYKIRFYPPVRSEVDLVIHATVATSYVAADVENQIAAAILSEYGESAAASRRGRTQPRYKRIYALLCRQVAAITDIDESDLTVSIAEPEGTAARPELWRFVSKESLSVRVKTANIVTPSWGG